MKKITPFLWFENNGEEVINFYLSIFKNAKKLEDNRIDIEGQELVIFSYPNPGFKFNESVSFFINCETQEEVDELWEKLSEGGEKGRCGWLKDRFGLSWQVVPTILGDLLGDSDKLKAGHVMEAMMKMNKINIEDLKKAYEL